MPRASRSMTGPSWTASSTPIGNTACGPTRRSVSCRKALSVKPEPYQHAWTPRGGLRPDLHRLGLSAEGLRQVGRTGFPVGQTLRGTVRPRRGGAVVLGGLERAEHRLLARHTGGVSQTPRLRHRRRAPRPADGAGGRAGRGRQRREVHARLPRALPARHQLRDRAGRHAPGFRLVSRQGRADDHQRPRPHGHPPASGARSKRASA